MDFPASSHVLMMMCLHYHVTQILTILPCVLSISVAMNISNVSKQSLTLLILCFLISQTAVLYGGLEMFWRLRKRIFQYFPIKHQFHISFEHHLLLGCLQDSLSFTCYDPGQLEFWLVSVFTDTIPLLPVLVSAFWIFFFHFNSLAAPCFVNWAFCQSFW